MHRVDALYKMAIVTMMMMNNRGDPLSMMMMMMIDKRGEPLSRVVARGDPLDVFVVLYQKVTGAKPAEEMTSLCNLLALTFFLLIK